TTVPPTATANRLLILRELDHAYSANIIRYSEGANCRLVFSSNFGFIGWFVIGSRTYLPASRSASNLSILPSQYSILTSQYSILTFYCTVARMVAPLDFS